MPKKPREVKGDPAFQRWALDEFVKWELACGGPDPHMRVAEYLAGWYCGDDLTRRAWFCGLYVAPYNVPTGEVLLQYFPTPNHVLHDPEAFTTWVHTYWPGLALRKERRPVRAPSRFAEHVIHYAWWVLNRWPLLAQVDTHQESFDVVSEVRYNGRYASMKLYETLRRATGLPRFPSEDIRPAGGWSPRLMLSWLYPEHAEHLNGNDHPSNLTLANKLAEQEKDRLGLDWFNIEVMLCDAKQAYDGKQYPGRGLDSELGHLAHVSTAFPNVELQTLSARAALFPTWSLGEVQGWPGRRVELGEVLLTHRYCWTDWLYDFTATTDLSQPVRRVT